MKKSLLIFGIVLTTFLLACTKEPTKKGNIMSLNFETNPSTGFEWQYEFLNGEELLEVVSDELINENVEKGIVGAPCQRKIKFKGLKSGKTTLHFVYKRPWAGGDTAYDVDYDIEVSNDLVISYIQKKNGGFNANIDLSRFPEPVFEK